MASITLRPTSASGDGWKNLSNAYDGNLNSYASSPNVNSNNHTNYRATFNFDVSSLAGKTINSATLGVRVEVGLTGEMRLYADINTAGSNRVINTGPIGTYSVTNYTANITNYINSLSSVIITPAQTTSYDNTMNLYEVWIDVDYSDAPSKLQDIYVGGNKINNIYLGNTPIVKVYLGDMQVYSKPSESSDDTIELTDIVSYYQEPTQTVVNEINSLNSTEYISFVVLSDIHMDQNSGNSQNVVRYILKNTNIDKFFFLGDISLGSPSSHEYEAGMRTFIDNCRDKLYFAYGNHDCPWDGVAEVSIDTMYNDMLAGRSNIVGNPQNMYYYFDDTAKKVRYVVINTSDGSDENVSTTQLEWLGNAVQLPTSDWKVAIFSHMDINASHTDLKYTVPQATQVVEKIKSTNGTIIGFFCGHEHVDDISVVDNSFYQTVFLCDKREQYLGFPNISPPSRTAGTVSEQAVSIVSINTTTGDVTIRRIGAGAGIDRSFNYNSLSSDPVEPTTYTITNNLTGCTNNNKVTSITKGASYTATITPNTNYTMSSITVTMGEVDITSSVVNGNSININNVINNIVITAIANASLGNWTSGVAYNLSIVADSYVEKDGVITAYTGWSRTDYTNCEGAARLVTNSTWEANYCCFYDSNKNFISTFTIPNGNGEIAVPSNASYFIASAETSVMATMIITPYSAT